MEIRLPYDKGCIEFTPPSGCNVKVLTPPSEDFKPEFSQEQIVRNAISNPIDSPPLSELAKDKKNIVIITSDHTRPIPSRITMPIILEEIKKTNPNAKPTLLISTGLHRVSTDEELMERHGQDVLDQVNVINHVATDLDNMVYLGVLPSGGELWINKLAVEADLLISEGFIEPHFFAGFSGGRKSILPGIASRKTVLYNHNSTFLSNPYARAGELERNPIHKDMVWAAKQAKLAFILNVAINGEKEVIHAVAGNPFAAHEQGCEFVKDLTGTEAIPADIVISTNGGYPLDQNVYQAVKGMTTAEMTAKPGSVIIMVSACKDGLGGRDFYHQLADFPSPQESMDLFMKTPEDQTPVDQWQSQILARILLKHKVIVVADESVASFVNEMHMEYAKTVEEAIEKAQQIKGRDASITVIPDGVGVIIK
ncbi:nickel-dependent lactate racemase [Desulfuribacillus alkaliarsenatis]|uniref:Lactate racemization operon protein LarA n=1 Tax=Desulfuribacillus alkaliarsenatis TaxID=766136 RepID=A0A1E5G1H5_9FIRM|nr:nickel-dependent lactate racemase [Desulfuribacillus alkaliarsenatis]OEF96686.1 lactate racemization operon protein LarA [Desulfuribacillus alkaliarsenatis]